jgi:ribA/ribD-fused uncharacterized protein
MGRFLKFVPKPVESEFTKSLMAESLFDPAAMPVHGFFDNFRFLSNFHLAPVIMDGLTFKTAEHAFMYQKSTDPEYHQQILEAKTPATAKRLGKKCVLRPDWDSYRTEAMYRAVSAKFKDPWLALKLEETGTAFLEETNTWKDTYWGVCNGLGKNMLGRILMRVRSELQK